MNHEHPETALAGSQSGPGAQLAQARTDLRLTHEEVAAKLHLATRQIQALEQDDYRSLPGPTYVRGYLKSYALLLGLAPGPILDAHARMTAAPVTSDFKNIAPQREITSRHHQVRFVTYIVALLVIGLAVAWWQADNTRPPNPLLTVPEQPAVTEGVPETDSAGTAKTPDEASPSDPGAAPVPATDKPESVPAPAPAAPASAPSIVTPAPKPIVTGPRMQLVLQTEEDSWADIRDARQVRLLYENVAAGRTVALEGVAPVQVYLGNPAGVRLDFNGKTVDTTRYRRGVTARFTLGESEPESPNPR